MRVSISETNSKFVPRDFDSCNDLTSLIKRHTWSCGVFKDNHRIAQNFIYADTIALDFDDGLNLEVAQSRIIKYKHIIATTRSHQHTWHRFRLILFLDGPIVDYKQYQETVKTLFKIFPEADKNCSDASRMWYPCKDIISINYNGLTIPAAETTSLSKPQVEKLPPLDFSLKPAGWSNCIWSISNGRFKKGEGNSAMMALSTNLKKLNYTKTQAYHICKDAYQLRGMGYDDKELWTKVIEQVYGSGWDGAKYVCNKEGYWLHDYCLSLGASCCPKKKSSVRLIKVGDLMKSNPVVDYLVDGLLTVGGISIIAGPPKSGKSTIVRQLTKSVVNGQDFLGRSTKKGKVIYLALEEQNSVLNEQFKKVGITETDDILIHVGGLLGGSAFDDVAELILDQRPQLLVIDTMLLFLNQSDSNNYNEMNRALSECRDLARRSGTHILTVHHQNKPPPGFSTYNRGATSIHGSTAIHGAMDCAMIFNSERDRRFLSSSQRGGTPFIAQELDFDFDTETYKLKAKVKNEGF